MVKIRVRSGRGTRIIEVDSDATKWTGKQFQEIQAAKKAQAEKAGIKYVTSGRGTGKISFSDIPQPKTKPDTKGMWVSSGRGTGRRKL
ncbi:MAG: hypothetical protein QQN58_05725 [Nitrosopumilus sp.]|nr:hypothetical protein [Nitrososphaerota archaeon]